MSSRALRAGLWATALQSAGYLLGLVRTVLIARLLAPDDVGLFGIAALAIAALEAFTHTGFREALVQRREAIAEYLSTAWTVQVLRNCSLAALLLVGAPLAAAFFREPAAEPLVRAVSIAVLISGFENIGVVRFDRHLDFGRRFQYNFSGMAADLLVSAGAAWLLRSPWALVYGLIAGSLVRAVASYLLSSFRPRWSIDRQAVRELFAFGGWITLNRVVHFLALKGDDIVVGRLLGPFALGIYQMAFQIGELAAREMTRVVSSVAFPAFSRIQSDRTRVRGAFFMTLDGVASIILPIAAVMTFVAEPLVLFVLGERWVEVAAILPILVWSASLRGVVATAASVYLALGHPRLSAQVSALRVVVLFVLIFPLAHSAGLVGVAWAVLVSTTTTIPFAVRYVRRLLEASAMDVVRPMAAGGFLALLVAAPYVLIHEGLGADPGTWPDLMASLAAVALYGLAAWGIHRRWGAGPLRLTSLAR